MGIPRPDQEFNYFKWEGLWRIGKLRGKQTIMQIHLIAMFRIISKHSKLCLEITSKYKNIQSHFKQQKYDHSIIPTQFTYMTISECYLLNHTN